MASDIYDRAIKAELAHWPGVDVEFSDRAKHRQAVFHFSGHTRFVTLPASPGDSARGHLNSIRDVRKELTALGASRLEKKPRARKRTNHVIGRQMPNPPAWTTRVERAPVKPDPFQALACVTFAPEPEPKQRLPLWRRLWAWLTSDSGSDRHGGDPLGAPGEASQSGAEGNRPSLNPERTPHAL